MEEIPLWRGGVRRSSLDRRTLLDYRGAPLASVHLAPVAMLGRVVAELRRAVPEVGEGALHWEAIERAGALLAGSDAEAHAELLCRATGAPLSVVRAGLAELANGLVGIEGALRWQAPGGDLSAFATHRVIHPDGNSFGWAPRGRVLGFVAPSNHPAVHLTWVLALAMGYSVLLRPGADDPFTPTRLVEALAAAGFPVERVAILSGGHELVPAMVEACDLTVAYGGEVLAGLIGRDERVLFNGPGRSKVLIDGPAPPEQAVPFLLDCILRHGGQKCTCASGILVRGEAPGLLEGLRSELRGLALLDPLDPAAQVPVWKGAPGALPASFVTRDGLRFIQPDLLFCADPTQPPFGAELPAPWATAAVIEAGTEPLPLLRGSLAVTLVSRDEALRARCLAEPSIQKLFTGLLPPWQSLPGAPHHGRLSDFLFTAKFAPEGAIPWS